MDWFLYDRDLPKELSSVERQVQDFSCNTAAPSKMVLKGNLKQGSIINFIWH